VAVVFTFGREAQLYVQAPQFFTSVMRFTHWLPHSVGVEPLQPGKQSGGVCSKQIGVEPLQLNEQLPQWADVLSAVSQPSSARLEQCAHPERQADSGT
jgi:hypothetical protein